MAGGRWGGRVKRRAEAVGRERRDSIQQVIPSVGEGRGFILINANSNNN